MHFDHLSYLDSDKSLIYSVRDQIKGVSLKSGGSSVIIQNIPNPVAVAPANDDVYWVIFERGLQAMKVNDYGYEEKTVITNGTFYNEISFTVMVM